MFEELKEASEGRITRINDIWRYNVLYAVRELMIQINEEIDVVKILRSHFVVEEGKLRVVKRIEEGKLALV